MDQGAREQAFQSALVTEHFVLQSAAGATISESSSRSSLYLLSLSSSLVALGFTAQGGPASGVFVAAVLPTVFVLGCFTIIRLVDTSIENLLCLRRIARIRRYYAGLLPDAPQYFPGTGALATDAQQMLGVTYTRWSVLFTMASMIGTVNAVVGGTAVGVLLDAGLGAPRWLSVLVGVLVGAGLVLGVVMYQKRRFGAAFGAAQVPPPIAAHSGIAAESGGEGD